MRGQGGGGDTVFFGNFTEGFALANGMIGRLAGRLAKQQQSKNRQYCYVGGRSFALGQLGQHDALFKPPKSSLFTGTPLAWPALVCSVREDFCLICFKKGEIEGCGSERFC